METLEQQTRNYEEKRNFIRMQVEIPMKYRDPKTGQVGNGTTHNLSANGLSFLTQEPLQAGHTIEVWISSFGNQIQPLKANMLIQRVNRQDQSGFLVTGSLENVE